MFNHPFIGDLSTKTIDELADTISTLNKRLQYVYRIGKHDMVNQLNMAIASYKNEYMKRQKDIWDKKSGSNLDKKIDIS